MKRSIHWIFYRPKLPHVISDLKILQIVPIKSPLFAHIKTFFSFQNWLKFSWDMPIWNQLIKLHELIYFIIRSLGLLRVSLGFLRATQGFWRVSRDPLRVTWCPNTMLWEPPDNDLGPAKGDLSPSTGDLNLPKGDLGPQKHYSGPLKVDLRSLKGDSWGVTWAPKDWLGPSNGVKADLCPLKDDLGPLKGDFSPSKDNLALQRVACALLSIISKSPYSKSLWHP